MYLSNERERLLIQCLGIANLAMNNITKRQVALPIFIQMCLQRICAQCQFASDSILGIHHGGIDSVRRQHRFVCTVLACCVHRLLAWLGHGKEAEGDEICGAGVGSGGNAGGFMDPSNGRSDPRQACEESRGAVWGQSGGKHVLAPDWCDARYGMLGKAEITLRLRAVQWPWVAVLISRI